MSTPTDVNHCRHLLTSPISAITSQLNGQRMVRAVVELVSVGLVSSKEEIEIVMKTFTLAGVQLQDVTSACRVAIQYLFDNLLIDPIFASPQPHRTPHSHLTPLSNNTTHSPQPIDTPQSHLTPLGPMSHSSARGSSHLPPQTSPHPNTTPAPLSSSSLYPNAPHASRPVSHLSHTSE
eukprot:GHVN01001127.1.p5 GENE.GHVN01001127.1~~GHVN01001127.1.p5  ORF type:complete len:178 (-),score=60.41 GHVN01001127.1:6983-7516(-)